MSLTGVKHVITVNAYLYLILKPSKGYCLDLLALYFDLVMVALFFAFHDVSLEEDRLVGVVIEDSNRLKLNGRLLDLSPGMHKEVL